MQSLAKKLVKIYGRYLPRRRAFNHLATLEEKGKDMRVRLSKQTKHKRWFDRRALQRRRTSMLKLNFVKGLLNRFFAEFLESINMTGVVKSTSMFSNKRDSSTNKKAKSVQDKKPLVSTELEGIDPDAIA